MLHLIAGQLAVWDFSESLSSLICMVRPCGWLWVSRAAMDPSGNSSCLQSQAKCRLPLERCEYAAESMGTLQIYGAQARGFRPYFVPAQRAGMLVTGLLCSCCETLHYFKEDSWDLQARSCDEIRNSSSFIGARLIYMSLVQHFWEIVDGGHFLFVCCTEKL